MPHDPALQLPPSLSPAPDANPYVLQDPLLGVRRQSYPSNRPTSTIATQTTPTYLQYISSLSPPPPNEPHSNLDHRPRGTSTTDLPSYPPPTYSDAVNRRSAQISPGASVSRPPSPFPPTIYQQPTVGITNVGTQTYPYTTGPVPPTVYQQPSLGMINMGTQTYPYTTGPVPPTVYQLPSLGVINVGTQTYPYTTGLVPNQALGLGLYQYHVHPGMHHLNHGVYPGAHQSAGVYHGWIIPTVVPLRVIPGVPDYYVFPGWHAPVIRTQVLHSVPIVCPYCHMRYSTVNDNETLLHLLLLRAILY